ncbi:Acetylcholinesterase [Nymphon striatum]|nr:Acetylcholinesterase [Nymphon striatum]
MWKDDYNKELKQVSSFLGIPYAKSPIGFLRFKRPVLNSEWRGILPTNESKPICMHPDGGSEDCLYINIWRPDLKVDNPLPFMVWIPGGFVHTEAITEDIGTNFVAMTDFILVTFSYRHGPFGFLYTGEEGAPGNVGLLDQQLALRWISQNIIHFSGDPISITIIGDGLGGASANYHLIAPDSRELFTRAIMMSGAAVAPWIFYSQEEARAVATQLFNATTCSTGDSVACLRAMSAKDLQRISEPDTFSTITYRPFPFIPTIDDKFITQSPSEYLKTGQFKKTEIVIGTN